MRLLESDLIKHRRTWVLPLTFLGPFGFVLMGIIMFSMSHDWILESIKRDGPWAALMNNMGMLEIAAIALGVALLASMVFDVEHRSGAWKQLFALPVSRSGVYLTKLVVVVGLIFSASVLASAGTAGLWLWLDLGALPWRKLGLLALVPWVAAFPLIAFQGLLSAHIRNQAIALTFGVAGTVLALTASSLPKWLPWALPADAMAWVVAGSGDIWRILGLSCAAGVAIAVAGALSFARRDVV